MVKLTEEPAENATDDLEALSTSDQQRVIELSSDGRMRAPDPSTRTILRDRLRRAEVLPTGRGWAVLKTIGPSEATAADVAEREVVAAGTMAEAGLSVIDFIGFLASGYQTGVLTVASGDVQRAIYFHHGDVVWASSTSPDDRLGALLVTRGRITKDQLDVVTREGGHRIGRLCVQHGFLSAHDLWAMVQAQLREIFDRLLAMDSGLWSFARVSEKILAESQIHLSTQGLLVDALRRLDELSVYRQRIRSADVLVHRVETPEDEKYLERLQERDRDAAAALLGNLPNSATIRTLMRLLGKSEFDVTRLVYLLLRANLVEVLADDTGPIPRRPSVATTEVAAVVEVYSLALREMFDSVARVNKSSMLKRTAKEYLSDDQTGDLAVLYRCVHLRADGTIDVDRLVTGLVDSGLDAQALSDALSELMFFTLFQATEILGRRRGDDLARRVKMIHAMLASGATGTIAP